jgi:hypothetical protein
MEKVAERKLITFSNSYAETQRIQSVSQVPLWCLNFNAQVNGVFGQHVALSFYVAI